jgi:hypothetical protein
VNKEVSKKVEIIGEWITDTYEQHVTEINNKVVYRIDVSNFEHNRKIILFSECDGQICEIYIPQNMIVRIF